MGATIVFGTALKPNVDWMREDCGTEMWEKVLGTLDSGDRKSIELINGAMRYPAPVFDHLNRAYAEVRHEGNVRAAGEAFRSMGRHTAEEHLTGIYSVFLKMASPEATLSRIPALLGRMYEGVGGDFEIRHEATGPRALMRVTGLGDIAYTGPRLLGWAEAALEKVGVANPRVVERAWQTGQVSADPLVFELYWV